MSVKDCSSVYHGLIRKNYVELTETLKLRDTIVIDRLYSKGVINSREKEVLQACKYNFERAQKLLDTFENRSQAQIEELIKTLIETSQDHVVKVYLTPTDAILKSGSQSQRDTIVIGASMNGHQLNTTGWPTKSPMYDPYDCHEETCSFNGTTDPVTHSISSALGDDGKSWYTLAGKIMKKSEVESYQGNTGVSIFFFTVTMCDATGVADIRVYQISQYGVVKPGKCYNFENVVRKAEVFVTVDRSFICRIPSIIIPKEVERQADAEFPRIIEENYKRSLNRAIEALNSSHIRGKITKISPVKYVKDGELPVRHLALIDTPGMKPVKLAVFADDAYKNYTVGQCIDASYVYAKIGDASELSLGTTTESEIKIMTDTGECRDLLRLESSVSIEDPDFDDQSSVDMKIYAIATGAIYDCCTRRGCYNKRLNEDGLCPVCGGSSSRGRSCSVKVKVEHEGRSTCHSLFKSELDKFLKLKDLCCYSDDEDLIDDICDQLPVSGKARFQGENMTIVTIKRKGEPHE